MAPERIERREKARCRTLNICSRLNGSSPIRAQVAERVSEDQPLVSWIEKSIAYTKSQLAVGLEGFEATFRVCLVDDRTRCHTDVA